MENIIRITSNNNYYTYIGNQKIDKNNIMNKYSNINNIINSNFYSDISYESNVWFTLNNRVNTGLHCDTTPNLIYMLGGKKTIYLFAPNYYQYLYINEYPLIKTI